MRCTSRRIDPQPFLNHGIQIHAGQQTLAIDSLDAREHAAQLILQSASGLAIMAKVVHDARQESGGSDGTGHHDDIVVGGDFFRGSDRAFRVENVVHEVSTVRLEFEASR